MIKKISKKNLSATFYIFSKCHFLSNGEGVSGHQAISGHPYQPTSNYRKNKKKKSEKKIQKKKVELQKKLVRSESLKWCHKLRRSHSKMELHNINSVVIWQNTLCYNFENIWYYIYLESEEHAASIYPIRFSPKPSDLLLLVVTKCLILQIFFFWDGKVPYVTFLW